MAPIYYLVAHTDLPIPTIQRILFDEIEVKAGPGQNTVLLDEGSNCSMVLVDDPDMLENRVLDLPENLAVTFFIGHSNKGFVSALKVVMNWLRNTTGDCAFVRDGSTVLLMRVDGNTVRSNSEDAWWTDETIELIGIMHEEADLGFDRWEDYLYIRSTHNTPQVAASFCQHLNDSYEIEITEASGKTYAAVEMDALSIEITPKKFDPHLSQRYQPWMDNRYGFVPNLSMYVLHKKIFWAKDGERDTPLRDIVLKGAIGLIRTTDYSLVLKLDSPFRFVLVYHGGELTLMRDPFWTEDRLLLFEDIPYKFKSP